MFGLKRRFVLRWECDTLMPKPGCLPHISHTAAIGTRHLDREILLGTGLEITILRHGSVHPSARRQGSGVKRSGLDVADLQHVMASYEHALSMHRDVINRLNVFPVPDGDTGTNMHLTLESVGAELARLEDAFDMRSTCRAISHGSLMGARGNSGVILCQILRGLASTFAGTEEAPRLSVGTAELVAGLAEANVAARAGVMKPVEGTILTVAAAAAGGAAGALADNPKSDLVAVTEAARASAIEALWRTPEQLPVLASAGGVDAGGAGLIWLFRVLLSVPFGESW
jgi:uncharacterized protein